MKVLAGLMAALLWTGVAGGQEHQRSATQQQPVLRAQGDNNAGAFKRRTPETPQFPIEQAQEYNVSEVQQHPIAQAPSHHFSIGVAVGTALSISRPASTPFDLHVTGWYALTPRLGIGAGTGISCYEKVLIPLFGDIRLRLTRPHRFTPFLACAAGYAFAPAKDANGGMYLNPNIGVEYDTHRRLRLFFAAGYALQHLERLKTHSGPDFTSAFSEQLRHNAISLRIGILF